MLNDQLNEDIYQKTGLVANAWYALQKECPLHWHSYMEVMYVVQDGLTLEVSGKTFTVKPNSVVLIWPFELHSVVSGGQVFAEGIQFDPAIMQQVPSIGRWFHIGFHTRTISYEDDPQTFSAVQSAFQKILPYTGKNSREWVKDFTDAQLYLYVSEMMLNVFRYERNLWMSGGSEEASVDISSTVSNIQETCVYMSQHCMEDITLNEMADRAGVSRYYYSRQFTKLAGCTFTAYLTRCRINYAKTLLASPENRISDVAMMAGFRSLATFNRLFHESEHVSPSEFRKMLSNRQE